MVTCLFFKCVDYISTYVDTIKSKDLETKYNTAGATNPNLALQCLSSASCRNKIHIIISIRWYFLVFPVTFPSKLWPKESCVYRKKWDQVAKSCGQHCLVSAATHQQVADDEVPLHGRGKRKTPKKNIFPALYRAHKMVNCPRRQRLYLSVHSQANC